MVPRTYQRFNKLLVKVPISFLFWVVIKSYSKVCQKLFSVSRVSSAFPKNSYRSHGLS